MTSIRVGSAPFVKHVAHVTIFSRSHHDEENKGTFYQSELQKVDVRNDDIWKIEKILKTKGKGNNQQYFIKWLHKVYL
jgi:hypothetical protein